MKTLSDYRKERKELQSIDKSIDKKLGKIILERIEYYLSEIEKEKESIQDCLDQNFWSTSRLKIDRIEKMQNQIINLRRRLS